MFQAKSIYGYYYYPWEISIIHVYLLWKHCFVQWYPSIFFLLFLISLSLSLNSSLFPCYQRLMVRSNFSSSLTYSSYTCLCGLNRIYTHAWASIKDCQDIRLRFYRWTLNTNLCHISSLYMLGVTNMKFYLEK